MAESILYQNVPFSVDDVNRLELLTDQVAALGNAANHAERALPRNKTVASLATTIRMIQVNIEAFFDAVSARVEVVHEAPARSAGRQFNGPVVREFRPRTTGPER